MKYVLDTSVILSGKDIPHTQELYIPPKVLDEIKEGGRWYRKINRMKSAGLKIVTPPGHLIGKVKSEAKKTGDSIRLSKTDVEVIALALYLEAKIVTDDYSIQNLAKNMDIEYMGIAQEEIDEEYSWSYRCKKCGRWYDDYQETCDVCGGEIKSARLM